MPVLYDRVQKENLTSQLRTCSAQGLLRGANGVTLSPVLEASVQVAQSWLTATSASWVEVILLPQPLE
ncbi:GALK2 isoform 6 [Pongo abelii]|uniref:GALK2 isoform 6 n=1 Tax=Pongo abelii TaxID=9601 RepID=A0A2J8VBF3_PONAB|nr:GALK2 isoform 6 [Pongo abelii]